MRKAELASKTVSWIILILLLVNMLAIIFCVQTVRAQSSTIYIRADGSIDPSTAAISSIDNITYTLTSNINNSITVEKDNIVIDGGSYTVQRTNVTDFKGIDLTERYNVTIENMNITGFDIGICLNSSSFDSISENNITGCLSCGIWATFSSNNSIGENNITNDLTAIFINSSSTNSISVNNITSDVYGIELLSSSNNSLIGNNIRAITEDAIWFSSSSGNRISGNKIANNWRGAYLDYSANNSIVLNSVTNNTVGIRLGNSSNNSVSRNNITANNFGISLDYSSNNSVHDNNFVNNTRQVNSFDSETYFDNGYPSGGNYWSDYNSKDFYRGPGQNVTGGDGIGDTPYVVDSNNTDHFPLMSPFETFNATWYSNSYIVSISSNSSIAGFIFSSPNWPTLSFTVTGADGTAGFCRVSIPTDLIWASNVDQWIVTVNNTLIPDRTVVSDVLYTYIYFTYHQSTETVQITVTELPSFFILSLFIIATLLSATVFRRSRTR